MENVTTKTSLLYASAFLLPRHTRKLLSKNVVFHTFNHWTRFTKFKRRKRKYYIHLDIFPLFPSLYSWCSKFPSGIISLQSEELPLTILFKRVCCQQLFLASFHRRMSLILLQHWRTLSPPPDSELTAHFFSTLKMACHFLLVRHRLGVSPGLHKQLYSVDFLQRLLFIFCQELSSSTGCGKIHTSN